MVVCIVVGATMAVWLVGVILFARDMSSNRLY